MSPTIYMQPGSTAFAAGKSLGQISREKEEYTRGAEQARLDLQKEQVENARQERELARIQREEQDNLAEIWRQKQFTAQQESARVAQEQFGMGFGLQEKQLGLQEEKFAAGQEQFGKEWEAKENKRLEDIEWMKKILGQVESGDVEVRGWDETGAPTGFKAVDKEDEEKEIMEEMQRVGEGLQLRGYSLIEEGTEPPADVRVITDRYGRNWYDNSAEVKTKKERVAKLKSEKSALSSLLQPDRDTGAPDMVEAWYRFINRAPQISAKGTDVNEIAKKIAERYGYPIDDPEMMNDIINARRLGAGTPNSKYQILGVE